MLLSLISNNTKEVLKKIDAADVVRVDGSLYVITGKSALLNRYNAAKIEDFEVMFQTEFHEFTWWELNNEVEKRTNGEWKIGNCIVCFLSIEPV